jgi:imidazolonepropionase-like amidohydrolase
MSKTVASPCVRGLVAAFILYSMSGPLAAQPASAEASETRVYVQGGRLLADSASGRVERDKTIVIADGKGVAIRDGFAAPEGESDVSIVNLRDSFVLPGKAADLIAVQGDLLQDVIELERVHFVMKGGRVSKQRAH